MVNYFFSTDIGQLDCDRDHCDHFDPGNPYDSQTYERGRRLLWRTKGKGTKEKDGWSEASRAYCAY